MIDKQNLFTYTAVLMMNPDWNVDHWLYLIHVVFLSAYARCFRVNLTISSSFSSLISVVLENVALIKKIYYEIFTLLKMYEAMHYSVASVFRSILKNYLYCWGVGVWLLQRNIILVKINKMTCTKNRDKMRFHLNALSFRFPDNV